MSVFSVRYFPFCLFLLMTFAIPCVLLFTIIISLFHGLYLTGIALVRRWVECDLRKKREGLDICALKERRPSAHLCTQFGRCQMHGKAFGYWNSASWGCFRGSGWCAGSTESLGSCWVVILSSFSVWITEHRPLWCGHVDTKCLKMEAYLKEKVKNFLLE